jgi:hypothetical protein
MPYDTTKYEKQDNPVLAEFGGVKLALNEKEELLLELFPSVAGPFLKDARKAAWEKEMLQQADAATMAQAPLFEALAGDYLS